jgi:SNF2 family DNA or RNA helicase
MTPVRAALTGTPMENSLQDLWTLFDWGHVRQAGVISLMA